MWIANQWRGRVNFLNRLWLKKLGKVYVLIPSHPIKLYKEVLWVEQTPMYPGKWYGS